MSDDVQVATPEPEPSVAGPALPRRRRWWRRLGTGVRRVLMFTAILLAVLSINLVGEGLSDALNPRLRDD